MARVLSFCLIAALCIAVKAFPSQQRMYAHHAQEQIHPLNYYLDSQDHYYGPEQKQEVNHVSNNAPARLETLEPDSEVELVPGVQPPQQPPQQPPIAPHIPGLLPGQRVFIIHMPIPGYRPGTIGGYQPVYVVGAAPQGNPGYPGNGYQNAILLDQSGQPVSPVLGYQKSAVLTPQSNPAVILGSPLALTRPLELGYQDFAHTSGQIVQAVDGIRGVHLIPIVPHNQGAQAQRVPAGHVQQNAAQTQNVGAGESEALLAHKDTPQSIKEIDPSKAKLRTGAIPRKA